MRSTEILQVFPQSVYVVSAYDNVRINQRFTKPTRCAPIPDEVYSFQTGIFCELYDGLANL